METICLNITARSSRSEKKLIKLKNSLLLLFPVGYDNSQVRLSGKFSHDPRDQRVLQFSAVFRELEPGERVYTGSSSE